MDDLLILVPVLARPGNVGPLVDSYLDARPPESNLVFIVNDDDLEEIAAIEAQLDQEHVVLFTMPPQVRTWGQKVNAGSGLPADWYLFAADDITFTPGWWEATEQLRNDPQVGVIGTNDSATGQGNPRVAKGEHTCHPLVRASYAALGTMDDPNEVVHSGYNHWCVDDELVWTAKLRNAWAFCSEAILEHRHPYWDKSIPWDDTYAKGEANNAADMELWQYRARHVLGLK